VSGASSSQVWGSAVVGAGSAHARGSVLGSARRSVGSGVVTRSSRDRTSSVGGWRSSDVAGPPRSQRRALVAGPPSFHEWGSAGAVGWSSGRRGRRRGDGASQAVPPPAGAGPNLPSVSVPAWAAGSSQARRTGADGGWPRPPAGSGAAGRRSWTRSPSDGGGSQGRRRPLGRGVSSGRYSERASRGASGWSRRASPGRLRRPPRRASMLSCTRRRAQPGAGGSLSRPSSNLAPRDAAAAAAASSQG
jgi:hypothetical protein